MNKLTIEYKKAPDALPCPFCGSDNIVTYCYEHAAGMRYAIMCMGCVVTLDPGWVQQPGVAVELWNKRKRMQNEKDIV